MGLIFRANCVKWGEALAEPGSTFACNHECTFCGWCAGDMDLVCPNCGGGLARGPRGGVT